MTKTLESPSPRTTTQRLQKALTTISILACAPYLGLKLCWLLGFQIGLSDAAAGWGATMWIINLGTAFMEGYALFLAVTFVAPWRHRIPAATVLVPMWIACGFLAIIVVGFPLQLLLGTNDDMSNAPQASPGLIEDWVFSMVYAGFFVLGLSLITNFLIHARERYLPSVRRATGGEFTLLGAVTLAVAIIVVKATNVAESGLAGSGLAEAVMIVVAVAVVPAFVVAQRFGGPVGAGLLWFTGAPFFSTGTFILVLTAVPQDLAEMTMRDAVGGVLSLALGLLAARELRSMIGGRGRVSS